MDNSLSLDTPSLSRRQLLNFLTGAVVASTAVGGTYPLVKSLLPPTEGGEAGVIIAKDQLGNPIPASQILAEAPGTRALIAGLAGEPTYLTVKADGTLDPVGIVNNCTHLGCTFPWNGQADQFQCPCHGSRFGPDGTVQRGPANRPLKLVHVAIAGEYISISTWTEIDPRTQQPAWWT
ncbi:MAG: cytochrome b6-f complex iron-sulfur subunit [Cyanobacteria bacterium P01_A01_bin.137]